MDIHRLFSTYQKDLLWMANTEAGRYLLGIKDKDPIIKVSQNSYHQLRDIQKDKAIVQTRLFFKGEVANTFVPLLRKMELADEYEHIDKPYDALLNYAGFQRSRLYPQIYLATFQALATSGGAGRVWISWQTWATCRAAATAENLGAGNFSIGNNGTPDNYMFFRCMTPCDTSSLTALATVTSGNIEFYRDDSWGFTDTDSTTIVIVPTTQPDPTTLALADFGKVSYSSKGSLPYASTTNLTYNAIPFSDVSAINKTGYSLLGLISGRDLTNSQATGTNMIGCPNPNPRYNVTYTLPVTTNYLKSYRRLSFQ